MLGGASSYARRAAGCPLRARLAETAIAVLRRCVTFDAPVAAVTPARRCRRPPMVPPQLDASDGRLNWPEACRPALCRRAQLACAAPRQCRGQLPHARGLLADQRRIPWGRDEAGREARMLSFASLCECIRVSGQGSRLCGHRCPACADRRMPFALVGLCSLGKWRLAFRDAVPSARPPIMLLVVCRTQLRLAHWTRCQPGSSVLSMRCVAARAPAEAGVAFYDRPRLLSIRRRPLGATRGVVGADAGGPARSKREKPRRFGERTSGCSGFCARQSIWRSPCAVHQTRRCASISNGSGGHGNGASAASSAAARAWRMR